MKNWKRFIAACLSVTMVASIPLTAFAESSVSVKELAPKASNESETQEETDLEKILSQEKPYECFAGLKNQQDILDACKDEELFQLKEYMKYAYVHESDLKNRQSLDAYLLISETWKNRKVTFAKEEQEQLLQFLENTNVYGMKYKDGEKEKTVEDFPTYMEYLQSIKKFEVPRYVELLSAFDEAKTEDDLAKAMEAFSNFEEEIYGFDEQETEKESEKDTSPETSVENPKGESNKNNSSVESVEEDSITPEEENEGTSIDNNSEITLELPEGYYLDSQLNSPDFYSERYIDTNRKTIHLYAGSSNKFGYISGKIYWITGDNTHVFCLDPLYKGPDSKEYTIQSIRGSSDLLTKVMYYGYSGPGFSNSGLSTGNSVTDYYYTHFVAAYVMEGCPGASSNAPWESRCLQMIGATHQANVFNWYKKIVNMPAPPSNARSAIFQGTANGSTNQIQRMGFFLWEAKKNYKLTLNPNGGVANGTTSPFTLSPDIIVGQGNWCTIQGYKPTRTGYTFTGWYDAPSGGTKVYGTDGWCVRGSKYWDTADHYKYEGNLTVYAQWTPNIAHITYNVQGGTVGNGYGTNSSGHVSKDGNVWFDSVSYGNSTDPYNASTFGLTKTGYHFGGWRIRSNGTVLNQDTSYGSTTYVDYSNSSLNTSNTSEVWCYLDAIWVSDTYTNTIAHWAGGFRNDEGNNGNKDSFKIGTTSFNAQSGSSYVMNADRAMAIPNGFYLGNNFGTPYISGSWGSYPMGTTVTQKNGSMSYEYYYQPYSYKISYNLNGGTNHSSNPSSYNVLYGVSLQNPTRVGYTFAGWEENLFRAKDAVIYNGASRNGETFTFTNSTSGNSFNAAKVQVWTNDFGRHIAQPVTAESGTNSNVSGKYTHNESTGNYIIRIAANGTAQDYSAPVYNVYLEKGKTYTFTIGSSSITSNKVVMGNIKVLGTATGINAGKNATFSNSEQLYSELAKRQIGDVELTAKWTPNTYTVKYDGNGATGGSTASSTHTYDVAKALTANGFTRTGYTFKGWNTKADGSGTSYTNKQSVKNLTSAKGATVTLYAQWTPNTYTIKYDGNGATGGSTASSTHTYDVAKALTANGFTKTGYTFKGWNTKADGSGTSYTNKQSVKNLTSANGATVTLYAQWTGNTITVKYHLNGGTDVESDNIFTSGDPAAQATYRYVDKTTVIGTNGLTDVVASRVTAPTGYQIKKVWNTKSDGSGKNFDFTTRYKLTDLNAAIEKGNCTIDLYAQYTENILTVNYYSNNATKTFTGSLNADQIGEGKNVLVRAVTYSATKAYNNGGLHDYVSSDPARTMTRDFYTGTKNWGTKPEGGILVNQSTNFDTGMALAKALGVNIEKGNATVNIYPQWTKNRLIIQYHVNGGTLTDKSGTAFTQDAEGYVLKNGKRGFQNVAFDEQIMNETNGFYNWNDVNGYININKVGYIAKKGAEWNTKPDGSGKSYSQDPPYIAKNVTDLSKGSVTLTVYVNWIPKKLVTTFHKNDGSTTTATQTFTYDVAGQKFSDKKWTRTGYTLLGWADSKTATKSQYAVLSGVSNAWIEKHYPKNDVYAVWRVHNYTIQYDGNTATGGSTPSSNHTYDKSQTLTPNGFEKDGYYFDSWNTKPDGSGNSYQNKESVKNLSSKDGDTVILYAQWKPINYKIVYKGNGSTGGTEKTHLYNQKDVEANGYAVKNNKGYTDFVRTNHTLVGWYQNSVVNTKAEMAKIYKQGSKLTYSQLLAIHAEQVKKGLVKDTDPKVKDILLYAVWDEAPSIDTSTMKKSKFYEGVDVTRTDLLNGITASDKIDGSLTSQIIITRIDYSAGKLVNGKKQAAYSQTWANGMPADAKLDTWFMQLDKKDSPVTHTVTYQVKDSAGSITTAKKAIQVVYNEFPVIKANDFRFTLDDAQAGLITKDKLLKKAVASGVISASDVEDGDMKSKIELIDYDANAFKTMKQEGFIPITYRVQDSMGPGGKGKVTLKTVNVNIYLVRKEETVRYVRFINKKYYDLNANLDRAALVGKYDQIALLSVNGGLHPFSVWYTDPICKKMITETFNKTTGTTYVYTKDDIKKMREFVKQHGVGNAKEEDALSKFADIFMTGDYILK